MQKFVVMADIHSNYPNFKQVLDYTSKQFPDINQYIFLGDYVLNGFDGNKVLDIIRSLSGYVIAGNKEEFFQNGITKEQYDFDQWKDLVYTDQLLTEENREYILRLPNTQIITVDSVKILLCHGLPYQARGKIVSNDFQKFDELIQNYDCDMYFLLILIKHLKYTIRENGLLMPVRLECHLAGNKKWILEF